MEHVQKCPTGLGVGKSRNTPQVMGRNYRRTADRSAGWQSDAFSTSARNPSWKSFSAGRWNRIGAAADRQPWEIQGTDNRCWDWRTTPTAR